jgi:hypothetical protein
VNWVAARIGVGHAIRLKVKISKTTITIGAGSLVAFIRSFRFIKKILILL